MPAPEDVVQVLCSQFAVFEGQPDKPVEKQCARYRRLALGLNNVEFWGHSSEWHWECLVWKLGQRGPWHCAQYLHQLRQDGYQDITLDDYMMSYLIQGEKGMPARAAERVHVLRVSEYLERNSGGHLWTWRRVWRQRSSTDLDGVKVSDSQLQYPIEIPPIHVHDHLVRQVLAELCFTSGDKLYELICTRFYQNHLYKDCLRIAAKSTPRQQEPAKFRLPPHLFPTKSGSAPFRIWCMDTISNLVPPDPSGGCNLMVMVDPFTKWFKVAVLCELNSHETAWCFHEQIVYYCSLPTKVCSDRGTEYHGEFERYLRLHCMDQALISIMHPHANGQVECINGCIKAGIHRMMAAYKHGQWWQLLSDVVRALRVLPSSATGVFPYFLVNKQTPELPVEGILRSASAEEYKQLPDSVLTEQLAFWDKYFLQISRRSKEGDVAIVETYLRRKGLGSTDLHFMFEQGNVVLIYQKRPGKIKVRAVGPYCFVQYHGARRVTASIVCPRSGKLVKVSIANLVLVQSNTLQLHLQQQTTVQEQDPRQQSRPELGPQQQLASLFASSATSGSSLNEDWSRYDLQLLQGLEIA